MRSLFFAVIFIALSGCAVIPTDTPISSQRWYEYSDKYRELSDQSYPAGNYPWWSLFLLPADLYKLFFVPGNWH